MSTPTLSLQPTFRFSGEFENLTSYLEHLSFVLSQQNFNSDFDTLNAISQLRNTLVQLFVQQIKQAAFAQGVWDFYPTTPSLIDKMIAFSSTMQSTPPAPKISPYQCSCPNYFYG